MRTPTIGLVASLIYVSSDGLPLYFPQEIEAEAIALTETSVTEDGIDWPISGRIVGGEQVRPGTYPFFVRIDKEGSQHCGGSLISSDVVLTAGNEATYCIDYYLDQCLSMNTGRVAVGSFVYRTRSIVLSNAILSSASQHTALPAIFRLRLLMVTITVNPTVFHAQLFKRSSILVSTYRHLQTTLCSSY